MKKRFLAALLTLACVCGLTACGGEKSGTGPREFQTSDLERLVEAGAFSEELEELDGDTAFALYKLADYGLEREDLIGCSVLRSAGATCEEAAVLVFGDVDMLKVDEAMKAYVNGQISANEDYRPDEIPKLERAALEIRGNSYLMAVAADDGAVTDAVEKMI